MVSGIQRVPLSRLKGVSVYFEDDLYELASLVLRLYDARKRYEGSSTRTRPTVNGLVKKFAGLIDPVHPDDERVLAALEERRLPMGAIVESDADLADLEE